jgi:hypothetical protein
MSIIHLCRRTLAIVAAFTAQPLAHSMAMTPAEFVKFLSSPPQHGTCAVTARTPVYDASLATVTIVTQHFEFRWKERDVARDIVTIQRTDGSLAESGIFKGLEWDHLAGYMTQYRGTNSTDSSRRRSMLYGSFNRLMKLHLIDAIIPATARLRESSLEAEIDMPSARARFGRNPLLIGQFQLSESGAVERLQYLIHAGGESSLVRFTVDYQYNGSWGHGYPSYIAVYESYADDRNPAVASNVLTCEIQIDEWRADVVPADAELAPQFLFPKARISVLSNDVLMPLDRGVGMAASVRAEGRRLWILVLLALSIVPLAVILRLMRATKKGKENNT